MNELPLSRKRCIISNIKRLIREYSVIRGRRNLSIPEEITKGKLYEAFILSKIVESLYEREGFRFVFHLDNFIVLRATPRPIDRNYPHFDVLKDDRKVAELWTDIEFLTLSHFNDIETPSNGDFHELDIIMVDPEIDGRPRFDQIWLGAECKNTHYEKSMLREMLGLRRELSYYKYPQRTRFQNWPCSLVNASPPSCLLAFSTDTRITNYEKPGQMFGINFYYENM